MFIDPAYYHVFRRFSWLKLKAEYEADTFLEPYAYTDIGYEYIKSVYGYQKDAILNAKHVVVSEHKLWNLLKRVLPTKYHTRAYSLMLKRF